VSCVGQPLFTLSFCEGLAVLFSPRMSSGSTLNNRKTETATPSQKLRVKSGCPTDPGQQTFTPCASHACCGKLWGPVPG